MYLQDGVRPVRQCRILPIHQGKRRCNGKIPQEQGCTCKTISKTESNNGGHNERFFDASRDTNHQQKMGKNVNEFNSPLGFNVPATQVKCHHTDVSLFCIGVIAGPEKPTASVSKCIKVGIRRNHPKINSGCEKKSVILSKRLLGSSTKVGRAILDRSIPGRTDIQLVSKPLYM